MSRPEIDVAGLSPERREELREIGKKDLFFFAKAICGYKDMTKRTHQEFCDWLVSGAIEPGSTQLGLMPRGHFKTSVNQADLIRRLLVDPEEQILIVNESSENAESMLKEIKELILDRQILGALYPEIVPEAKRAQTWNSKQIVVPRKYPHRMPSIDTAGVTSKITSRHYDFIYGDDLIAEEALYSPTVMWKSIKFVNRLVSLTVNPRKSRRRIIGTRWAFSDVYSHIMETMSYDTFIRKAIVQGPDGPEPFFPERYTMEIFQDIIENDPEQWATQMANDPLDTSVADFKKSWLQYFIVGPDYAIRWTDDEGIMHRQPISDLRIYIHVDPSPGDTDTGDQTGIVVVGINHLRQVFVLDAWEHRVDPLAQREKILELANFWHPRMVSIEKNAYQVSLRYAVEEKAKERGIYVNLKDYLAPSNRSKGARVRASLQPLFSTRRVWVRKGLIHFIERYLHFGKDERDHLLDAMAQGPTGDKEGPYWRYPIGPEARRLGKRRSRSLIRDLGPTGAGV